MRFVSRPVFLMFALQLVLYGQTRLGRIVLELQDKSGARVPGVQVQVASDQTHVSLRLASNESGEIIFRGLPFGVYRLSVDDDRFESAARTLLVTTEVTQSLLLWLNVKGPASQVTISNLPTFMDPQKINSSLYQGETQIRQRLASFRGTTGAAGGRTSHGRKWNNSPS